MEVPPNNPGSHRRHSNKHSEEHNAQRAAAMEEVKRIIQEEVHTDWIDLWDERWRRRLEVLTASQSAASEKEKERQEMDSDDEGAEADTETEGEDGLDDQGDEEEEGEEEKQDGDWDKAGGRAGGRLGREREEEGGGGDSEEVEGGEEIWVNRGDDSDFLKAADIYPSPSTPHHEDGSSRTDRIGGGGRENWMAASMNRLMGSMGLSSHSHAHPQARSSYPSSSNTPSLTAATTPTTLSANPSAPGSPPTAHGPAMGLANPYRFATPESITPSLDALREQKKQELERQMDLNGPEGNVGLRCWMERRDWWTGADHGGRVRLGKSKFEDNFLTRSVNEAAYPAIYSKCIKKALPPVVPINLRHVTNAMVAGWKREGEWPPPTTAPEPSFSRKKVRVPGRSGGGSGGVGASEGTGAKKILGIL